jgi:DNA-directed RNA polymerase I, II, and III subunit RPABC5
MIIPVRCYTCGKVLGDKWEHYNNLLKEKYTQPKAFEILGLKRYCCKRVILGHVDIIDTIMKYDDKTGSVKVENYTTINVNKVEEDDIFQ